VNHADTLGKTRAVWSLAMVGTCPGKTSVEPIEPPPPNVLDRRRRVGRAIRNSRQKGLEFGHHPRDGGCCNQELSGSRENPDGWFVTLALFWLACAIAGRSRPDPDEPCSLRSHRLRE
jgi:hypothetical protein